MNIPVKKLADGRALPVLGLGTWHMGGDAQKAVTDQVEKDIKAIRYAIESGYSHIDTAEVYADGFTEEMVAEAIQPLKRDDIFLASKAKQGNHTKQKLAEALDGSLKRLKTDYLDLYYLHRFSPDIPLEETAEALNTAVKAGKVKQVGVSNFSAAHVDELQKFLDVKIFANQVHYNLAFREPALSGLLAHAVAKDYFVVAWRPLRFIKRNAAAPLLNHNVWEKGAFPIVDALAATYQVTNVQVALAWLVNQQNVTTLVKSSQAKHLDEASAGAGLVLTAEDMARLTAEFQPQFAVSDSIPLE